MALDKLLEFKEKWLDVDDSGDNAATTWRDVIVTRMHDDNEYEEDQDEQCEGDGGMENEGDRDEENVSSKD